MLKNIKNLKILELDNENLHKEKYDNIRYLFEKLTYINFSYYNFKPSLINLYYEK